MPCDSIQLNRVDVAKMAPDLLAAVHAQFTAEGVRVDVFGPGLVRYVVNGETIMLRGGTLESEMSPARLAEFRNRLAQSYSKRAMFAAAKLHGWRVKQTGANQYEVQR
jgi:hypothetical protein